MRIKNKFKRISVSESVYKRLIKDRNHFQKLIKGGKWSISDTIEEYFKLLPKNKEALKNGINKRGSS